MRERPHRAGELAHAHPFGGPLEAPDVALHLGVPTGQLQAKGDGLGVHAMGASGHGRVLELLRAPLEHKRQPPQVFGDDGRCGLHLQRLRRVHNVIRREPIVQPARGLRVIDLFGDRRGEGDHVMLHLGFNSLHAR